MRKGILPAEELHTSFAARDGQLILRLDRPAGRLDLPRGALGAICLGLDELQVNAPGYSTELIQRPDEEGERFVLLELVVTRSTPTGVIKMHADETVRRCYMLAQMDAQRLERPELASLVAA